MQLNLDANFFWEIVTSQAALDHLEGIAESFSKM